MTTTISTSIDSITLETPVIWFAGTPRSEAIALGLTVGAPILLAPLTPRRTLKLALELAGICRLSASCRRSPPCASTVHDGSLAHKVDSSACAIRAAVTPAGRSQATLAVWKTSTFTVPPPPLAAWRRRCVTELRSAQAAKCVRRDRTTEVVAYDNGGKEAVEGDDWWWRWRRRRGGGGGGGDRCRPIIIGGGGGE